MFIHVEIVNEPVIQGKPYQDKSTGMLKPAQVKQNAYLHCGRAFPLPFTVKVPDAGPYRPGKYLMTGDVFKTGEWGLDYRGMDLVLVPFDDAVKFMTGKAAAVAAAA